jgi:hypothetical protein
MTIYIDKDYKCYTQALDGLVAIETNFFDGKCNEFIEGYRFIPSGESWVRGDGVVFHGEMISPWKNYAQLESA